MIKALLWNEWRQQRTIILWLVTIELLFNLLMFPAAAQLPERAIREDVTDLLVMLTVMLPYAYSIIYSQIAALEFKKGTIRYLLSQPVSADRIFWCKYLFYVAVMAILAALALPMIGYYGLTIGPTDSIMLKIPQGLLLVMFLFCLSLPLIITATVDGHRWCLSILCFAILGAVVMLFPCIQAGVLWCRLEETFYAKIPSAIYLTVLACSLVAVAFGWQLWHYGIARGLPVHRILLRQSALVVIAAPILYGTVMATLQWQWNVTRQEVVSLQIPVREEGSVSNAENAAPLFREFNLRWGRVAPKMPRLAKGQSCFTAGQLRQMGPVMTGIDAQNADEWVQRILQCRHYRIDVRNEGWFFHHGTGDYLKGKAQYCAFTGDLTGFFTAVKGLLKLSELVWDNRDHYSADTLCRQAYELAIRNGPEKTAALPFYRDLLAGVDAQNPWRLKRKDELLRQLKYMLIPSSLLWWQYPVMLTEDLIVWQDLLAAKKQVMAEEKPGRLASSGISRPLSDVRNPSVHANLVEYCGKQEQIMIWKLALAVRIYHLEHGVFPDRLEALVPSILPRVFLDPLCGKPFSYGHDRNGFWLSSNQLHQSGVAPLILSCRIPESEIQK